MDRLGNLLFELSNEDRLRILLQLQEEALRLSHLSERLDLVIQETSRHLSRLCEAGLIEKGADGRYRPTPYGEHATRLLPGFQFLSEHRDHFTTHTLSRLPDEFACRIGDLASCDPPEDVMATFHIVENLIQEAREYVWILSDQILMSTVPLLEEAVKRGASFRLILPRDLVPPDDFKPIPEIPGRIERRTLERVDVSITMSEKLARVALPTVDGSMDYVGFGTKDERGHRWCRDLFLYYWERADPGRPKGYPSPL
jgi:predicted transcriptional regulator